MRFKIRFSTPKKIAKKKLSNAFKALQNESLKVLNQFLETIYEYKSYFGIFSFFTFCSYFPGIPHCCHCASLGVSPLCLPRCAFPFWGRSPRAWLSANARARLRRQELLASIRISMCFSMFLILSMIYIYIIFIIITSKIRCSSKHLLTACHVVDLIHDEVLGSSTCFSMFLILSMMSFLDFPGVFAGFWSYQWYIYIIFIIITSKIRCSSKHLLTACHVVDLIHDEVFGSSTCFSMFLILSMMSFLDFPGVFAGFWSYPWWVSWNFHVFSMFLILSVIYIYIYKIFIINTNNIRCSSKHLLTACHVVDLIHDEVLGSSTCFSMFLILSMMIFLEFPCVLQVFDLTNDIYI